LLRLVFELHVTILSFATVLDCDCPSRLMSSSIENQNV